LHSEMKTGDLLSVY